MATLQDLVNQTFKLIGVLDPGETPSASESTDALATTNQLLSSWSAQALPIYQLIREQIPMTGAASYALPVRPVKIKAASITTSALLAEAARIVDAAEWAAFEEKAITKPYAAVAFFEDGYPLARIHLAPVPSAAGTIEIYSAKPARETGLFDVRESFPLTGVSSYTIGIGGNFVTERPAKLKGVSIQQTSTTSKPVELVTADRFAQHQRKADSANFADMLYVDNAFPTATIWLAPKPTAGSLDLWSYRALTAFAALGDTISLPPGYERALRMALAVELAAEYGRPVDATMSAQADDAKMAVFGLNKAILGGPGEPPANVGAQPPQQVAVPVPVKA